MSKPIRIVLFALLAGPAFAAPDQLVPAMGGQGGGPFLARCEKGDVLNGFDLRTGDDVDWIRPICVTVRGPAAQGERKLLTNGFGGSGGSPTRLTCPDEAPAIAGLSIHYEGLDTVIVNAAYLYCSVAIPNQPLTTHPTTQFRGPTVTPDSGGLLIGPGPDRSGFETSTCPPGLVPVGIHGRSGIWLDAIGLICGALPDAAKQGEPVKSLGRVNPSSTPGPARSICEAARDARARNSPAAANLEAQCKASNTVKTIGRVKPSPSTQSAPGSQATRSICDSARDARARNSPAAPNLETQCRAAGGSATAVTSNSDLEAARARGEALASVDPLAAELRNRLPDDAARRGFDVGLGIWDGNTAPGPGKQRYHDALVTAEQRGFDTAAAYSLPRNKYAALVNAGAVIAEADEEAAAARAAEDDVFFWLGFDIASGMFGDAAAGAEGNKSMGAGPMAVRDSLNAVSQRGFNAGAELHLARSYP